MPRVAASPRLHPADRAVRDRDGADPQAAAVLTAFAAYEGGDDGAAREALQAVGLQSPFLDWKLLVRGLLAHAAGETDRAAENWKRLDPRRLPAKLAAPVWSTFDPARATPTVARRAAKLTCTPLPDRLGRLRTLVGRGRALGPAFAEAATVAPTVRAEAPHLMPRLAAVFYRAVREHGEKADLLRFRAVFGPPADDPEFHRLEALVYEDGRRPLDAAPRWVQYERWLATDPPGWPPAVRDRARAVVLHRAAGLGRRADAPELWARATALAPDWDAPALALFEHLRAGRKPAEAEAVARRLLDHRPDHLPALAALATLFDAEDRPLDLLHVRRRALELNPLDAAARSAAVAATARAARSQVIAGDIEAAAHTLLAAADLADDAAPAGFFVLRAAVARKLGQAADADADLGRANSDPADRLATAYLAAVDAGLAKLKPKDRKPLADALTAALAGPATPAEALRLAEAVARLKADRVSYRGQVAHARAADALVLAAGPGDAGDYEALGQGLAARGLWKLVAKLAPALRPRFPLSPVFPLLEVDAGLADGRVLPFRLAAPLREARRLAEASKDLRHRALLDRISGLERQVFPFDLVRSLFDEG